MHLTFTLISIVLVWEYVGISALRREEKVKQKHKIKQLELSPWELFVLNDIMTEISLLKCPSMKSEAMRSMKSFVTDSVKSANTKESMNPDFWPTYNNLVQCMDHLDEAGKNKGEVMKSAAAVMTETETDPRKRSSAKAEEAVDDKKGWRANAWEPIPGKHSEENKPTTDEEAIIPKDSVSDTGEKMADAPPKPAEADTQVDANAPNTPTNNNNYNNNNNNNNNNNDNKGTLESMNTMMSKMKSWFPSFMGGGGGMSGMGSMPALGGMPGFGGIGDMPGLGRFKRSRTHHASATEQAKDEPKSDAHQKFQRMFLTIHQILRKSCPVELRPSGRFSGQVIREFLAWISKDTQAFSEASKKYFDQDKLLQDAQKCLLELSEV